MSKSTCPCEQIYASATSQGSALVQTGDMVTANASATASSPISYADALSIATKDAQQLANNYAQHDADVIDQTLRIVNAHSLIPSTTGITVGSATNPYSKIYIAKGVVLGSNSLGNQVTLTSSNNMLYVNDAQVYTSANPQGSTIDRANTFFGTNAGNPDVTGYLNSAFGTDALQYITSGQYNTSMGSFSQQQNRTGEQNVSVGNGALQDLISGSKNVAVGYATLSGHKTGNNTTAIGHSAGVLKDALTNCTSIGNEAICEASNQITLGNRAVTALRCAVTSITAISDRRDKKDIEDLESSLEFIEKLKPVRFNWNMRDGGKVDIPEVGFIAQDLQQVQQDTGMQIPNLVYDVNPEKLEASYGALLPLLVKSIQELSQDNKRLNAKIQELIAKNQ
jgi:hypothetical protein